MPGPCTPAGTIVALARRGAHRPIRSWRLPNRMLLEGKKLLVTGVLTDDSIAYAIAKVAQEAGAEIVLTSFGRAARLTEKVARRLPGGAPDILELDINDPAHIEAVSADLMKRWGYVD
ncbi:MAG: SDR family oxidoreductase, partial [Candidatus Limnocylindria bacterium]